MWLQDFSEWTVVEVPTVIHYLNNFRVGYISKDNVAEHHVHQLHLFVLLCWRVCSLLNGMADLLFEFDNIN